MADLTPRDQRTLGLFDTQRPSAAQITASYSFNRARDQLIAHLSQPSAVPAEDVVRDKARLDWLDEQITSGVVTMAFEMDGGVFLDVQPVGEPEQSYREKNDIRAAIDAAIAATKGADRTDCPPQAAEASVPVAEACARFAAMHPVAQPAMPSDEQLLDAFAPHLSEMSPNFNYGFTKAEVLAGLHRAIALYREQQPAQPAQAAEPTGWIAAADTLPPEETPVLLLREGEVVVGERRWEHPTHEETFSSFWFWADTQDNWHDDHGEATVTHWMPIPTPPADTLPQSEQRDTRNWRDGVR